MSSVVQQRLSLLTSGPGAVHLIATAVVAPLTGLDQVNEREFAALAGACPFTSSSGTTRGRRMIRASRARVLSGPDLAAMIDSRHNRVFMAYYQPLLQAGKAKKVALAT